MDFDELSASLRAERRHESDNDDDVREAIRAEHREALASVTTFSKEPREETRGEKEGRPGTGGAEKSPAEGVAGAESRMALRYPKRKASDKEPTKPNAHTRRRAELNPIPYEGTEGTLVPADWKMICYSPQHGRYPLRRVPKPVIVELLKKMTEWFDHPKQLGNLVNILANQRSLAVNVCISVHCVAKYLDTTWSHGKEYACDLCSNTQNRPCMLVNLGTFDDEGKQVEPPNIMILSLHPDIRNSTSYKELGYYINLEAKQYPAVTQDVEMGDVPSENSEAEKEAAGEVNQEMEAALETEKGQEAGEEFEEEQLAAGEMEMGQIAAGEMELEQEVFGGAEEEQEIDEDAWKVKPSGETLQIDDDEFADAYEEVV